MFVQEISAMQFRSACNRFTGGAGANTFFHAVGHGKILNKSNNNLQRCSLVVENCKGQLFFYQVMDGF